jgi:hypothetical protein
MKTRTVRVKFEGEVEVQLPDHMPDNDASILAEKLALARILATTDNPDAPEDAACDEYLQEGSVHASEADWDETNIVGVNGSWILGTRLLETGEARRQR